MDMDDCCCCQPDPWVDDLGRRLCFKCMLLLQVSHSTELLPTFNINKDRYHFEPLVSASGIRLLRLFPGSRVEDICCEIVHVDLNHHPAYDATSYTWGDPFLCKRVFCCTSEVLVVTKNCEAALRDLRLLRQERLLWIDAMCIDQTNIHERNHQVKIMQRIYAQAKRVMIHLGPEPTPEMARALQNLLYPEAAIE